MFSNEGIGERMAIDPEIIDKLLADCRKPERSSARMGC
jgi:hypothetical protein